MSYFLCAVMAEPSATRASTRKRSRTSKRLGSTKKTRATQAQGTKAPRSQLQQDRLSLGTARALRDRILQHQGADGVPDNLKPTLRDVQKRIVELESKITRKATVEDVRAQTSLLSLLLYPHLFVVVINKCRFSKCWMTNSTTVLGPFLHPPS